MFFGARNEIKQIGNGPDLNYGRNLQACGIFFSNEHGGRPVLVAAGSGNFGPDGPRSSKIIKYWNFSIPGTKWELSSKQKNFLNSFFFIFYIFGYYWRFKIPF